MRSDYIREEVKRSIKKNFWRRLNLGAFILVLWLLMDEYLKEGYLFNPSDITRPFTHEFLISVTVIIMICLNQYRKCRRW